MELEKLQRIKEAANEFSTSKNLIKWAVSAGLYQDFIHELKDIPEYGTVENIAYSILKDKPIKVCPVCGKYIDYNKTKRGKDKFCSDACYRSPRGLEIAKERRFKTNIQKYGSYEAAKKAHHDRWIESIGGDITGAKLYSKETRLKAQKTMLDRYGATTTLGSAVLKAKVENTMEERYGEKEVGHCKEIRDKIDKTNLEKYGHRCVFGSGRMQEKIKKSNIKKYGVEYAAASKIVQDKIKQTNLERYSVNYPLENKEIYEKSYNASLRLKRQQVIARVNAAGFDLVGEYKGTRLHNHDIKCCKCGTIINRNLSVGFSYRCPVCEPYNTSECENAIIALLNKWNIKFVPHVRNILSDGKELDIVIEDKKVAIEIDGIYWHTEAYGKDKNYHLNKTIECEKSGYRLIHIFSDEIKYKFNIVKNRLAAILGVRTIKVPARKCEIRKVKNDIASKFINKYHIQGNYNASLYLGLYYKNRIIAIMSFCTPRYTDNFKWELVRYCTIGAISVIGGASKLLAYFKNNYKGSIISYADRRWSDGNLYNVLGFIYSHDSEPGFAYIKGEKRENRFKFTHELLKETFENYNENCSVEQNMIKNGYNKIWDCGNKVYILKND